MQEGVASEACSLAGHLGLGKLIVLYDDNNITIDGDTALSFSEDVAKRYEAYNWHVQKVGDVNNLDDVRAAIKAAVAVFADAGRSIKEFMAEVVAAFTANITLLAEGACPIEVNYVKLDAAGIAADLVQAV